MSAFPTLQSLPKLKRYQRQCWSGLATIMAEVGVGQPDGEGEEEDEVRFTLVRFPNPAPDFKSVG